MLACWVWNPGDLIIEFARIHCIRCLGLVALGACRQTEELMRALPAVLLRRAGHLGAHWAAMPSAWWIDRVT